MTIQMDEVLEKWLKLNFPYILHCIEAGEAASFKIEKGDSLYATLHRNFSYEAKRFDQEYHFWQGHWGKEWANEPAKYGE